MGKKKHNFFGHSSSFIHQSFELGNGFAEVSLLSCETDLLNYKEIGECPV